MAAAISPHPGPLPRARRRPRRRRLLGATPSGDSSFTLRWSDGTVSLVKVVAKTEVAGKLLAVSQVHRGDRGHDPARQVGRARAGHPPPHGRGRVAVRRAVRRQADRRHPSKRGPIGRQDRNADRSRPGHSRARDGDGPRSQRHDALCRHGRRVDPVVAFERRAGGRSRHRAAVAGKAGHYLAAT